jgi:hypothetical protein
MSFLNSPRGARMVVMAGTIFTWRKRASVGGRSGDNVVLIRLVAAAIDHIAEFIEARLFREEVGAVEFGEIVSDNHTLRIAPWAGTNSVARVNGLLTGGRLGAEIRVPVSALGACRGRELRTILIRAAHPAEIASVADTDMRDEETHARVICGMPTTAGSRPRDKHNPHQTGSISRLHSTSPVYVHMHDIRIRGDSQLSCRESHSYHQSNIPSMGCSITSCIMSFSDRLP